MFEFGDFVSFDDFAEGLIFGIVIEPQDAAGMVAIHTGDIIYHVFEDYVVSQSPDELPEIFATMPVGLDLLEN